ncbi:MAG: DNA repair protein RadC [Eubacteriales bacterium]|nr:DNA repair protein RadC [Eubacteriales bacterium]
MNQRKRKDVTQVWEAQTIRELPAQLRPYEKCEREGAGALSDGELLAVILRSGTKGKSSLALANRILRMTEETSYPGLLGLLHLSLPDLMKIDGIGKVKAIQLKCIGELSKRMAKAAARPQVVMDRPATIAGYYMEQLRHEEQELLICMMFDMKNHFLGDAVVSKGTVNSAIISPREIFLAALRLHATGIVLIHNHPSGEPAPSSQDLQITQRIYLAGEMVGIRLLDHIIIGDRKYESLRNNGIMDMICSEGADLCCLKKPTE